MNTFGNIVNVEYIIDKKKLYVINLIFGRAEMNR